MIIECSSCQAKYQYDEARFEGKPAKKIRCAKCQQIFDIHNPAAAGAMLAPPRATVPIEGLGFPPPEPVRRGGAGTGESTVTSGRIPTEPLPPETHPGPTPTLPASRRYSLAVINGPDSGTVFRVDKSRIVLGRSGADIVLNDIECSRNHAAVEIREGLVRVMDLGSTNGTLVDNERIEGMVELQNHSEFQIGVSTLMLIITDID